MLTVIEVPRNPRIRAGRTELEYVPCGTGEGITMLFDIEAMTISIVTT